MRRNVIIAIVSIAIGLAAAVLSVGYLRSAQTEIATENEPIEVFVAQEDLPQGTTAEDLISKKLIEIEKVPRQFVPVGAISSARTIENQVLAVAVSAGEQLTSSRFTFASDAGLAVNIPEDLLAVSVDVDDVAGVAGLLKPGDTVIVFASFNPDGGLAGAVTRTLIPKARILAVGSTVSGVEEEAAPKPSGGLMAATPSGAGYKTVTLALAPADAARIVFARKNGAIHLALVSQTAPESNPPKSTSFQTISE